MVRVRSPPRYASTMTRGCSRGALATGRGRDGKPSQLLAVTPFDVDRTLVDAQVRVEVEEV